MLLDADGNPIPETPEEDKPQYVSKDDYDRLAGLVTQMQSTITAGFDALAAQRQTRQEPEPEIEDVADEELEQALNSGTGADKFRKMVQAAEKRLMKQHIDPLRAEGHQAIASLVQQTVANTLPHYKRFEKEITTYMDRLAPAAKANAEAWKIAHDIVVGQHSTELVNEAIEAMKRGGGGAPNVNTPGQNGRASLGQQPGATLTKPPDAEQTEMLANKGVSADQFAMKLGYTGWDDYMEKTKEYN